jgi:hypothetical protein
MLLPDKEHGEWLQDQMLQKERAETSKIRHGHKPLPPQDDDEQRRLAEEEEELKRKKRAEEEEEEDDDVEGEMEEPAGEN